jgi:hypothetical protein
LREQRAASAWLWVTIRPIQIQIKVMVCDPAMTAIGAKSGS